MSRAFIVPDPVPLSEQRGETFTVLVALMQRLLADDGCPWDREQTFSSLRRYVMEEACEVIDAIDQEDRAGLSEELGDLALQVVFLSELGRREGSFGPDDALRSIVEKLVRRHPHVFDDGVAHTPAAVERRWDAIKAEEKRNRPLLDDIARALPALDGARRISERAAQVGFDWPDPDGSRDKVHEELGELEEAIAAGDQEETEKEFGDVLFALVNYGRHLGVDPERALRRTSDKFRARFSHVEARVRDKYGDWPRSGTKATKGIPLEELDGYWNDAKRQGG